MNEPQQNQQWLATHYRDVVMSKFGQGRVGVIGDTAHAMSPQLGQGANMALLDAWALGQAVQVARDGQIWIGKRFGSIIISTVSPLPSFINF